MNNLFDSRETRNDQVSSSTSSRSSIPPFVIKATFAASVGGILFGYDMGVTSTALPQLKASFGLSRSQQEMVVSFLYIGCSIGATAGGFLCDRYGRKRMILVTDSIFVLAALVLYTAWTFDIVLLGRILVGFAVAVSGIADVAYLHEISPKEYRGAIVSCNEACISLGFMLSYLIGYAISVHVPQDGWRLMFGIGSIIAILQFVAMLFMPESPIWLKQHDDGNNESAATTTTGTTPTAGTNMKIVMTDIVRSRSGDDVQDYNDDSEHQLVGNRDRDNREPAFAQYSSLNVELPPPEPEIVTSEEMEEKLTLQTVNKYYRQVIISLFLSVMQNFCGHPNVLNFAPEIFAQIGFTSETDQLISTTFIGVVSVVEFILKSL